MILNYLKTQLIKKYNDFKGFSKCQNGLYCLSDSFELLQESKIHFANELGILNKVRILENQFHKMLIDIEKEMNN